MTSREPFPHPNSELALDLNSAAVSLLERGVHDGHRDWIELGRVPLAGPGFRAGIEALRQKAEARGPAPLTLLLPPEQILIRRYVLGRGSRDRDEALCRIAADSGRPAATLAIALSPAGDGELVTVLATSRRTVEEALDYARRWGFRPHAVSTRAGAERFGLAEPSFEPAAAAPRRAAPARVAAMAAGLVLLGLGAWGSGALMPTDPPAVEPRQLRLAADGSASPRAVPGVAPRTIEPAGRTAQVPIADAASTRGGPGPMPPRPDAAEAAVAPAAVAPGAGPGAGEPAQRLAAVPPALAATRSDVDLAPLLAGIEAEVEPEPGVVLAASDMAPLRVPGRPVPRPTISDVAAGGAAAEEGPAGSEGSDAPGEIEIESDSRLAVASAPRPAARPERSRGVNPANVRGALPPGIAGTAVQAGLALGATSLIGVIDARSGREALLRLPSGDFLKVARGDTIAGWRVGAIGQDTMRLTRGGESRTLLLVTR